MRSEKRPLYNLDDSDDDDFVVGKGSKSKQEEKPAERIERDDAVWLVILSLVWFLGDYGY